MRAYRTTPLSDCGLVQPHTDEPRHHRDEDAGRALTKRLTTQYGASRGKGLWLVPGVRLPPEAEGLGLLIVGDRGSGKSNILRALASQAMARGDRVLLHCVKGDVAQSFGPDEAVLIGAHHADGWAWDAATDLIGDAAYMDLAAAVIPMSEGGAFWALSARAVFVDVLHDLVAERGRAWTFMDLFLRLLEEPDAIQARVARLDFSASPLLGQGEDGVGNTTFGIMATLWSGALSGLRPLALAWALAPRERRFSVRRWLRGHGPRTVILQTAPEYEELSRLVSTILLGRVLVGISDPSLPVNPKRRITLLLDEFASLGRIPRIETALALGREKGLMVNAAVQSLAQIVAVYGAESGQVVQDLFRLRIFSALAMGASADRAEALIGRRTLVWRERNDEAGRKGPYRIERGERPLLSTTSLTRDLGVRLVGTDPTDASHKRLRAAITGLGDVYELDWPLTIWPKKREGYVAASWLTASRKARRNGYTASES
ncbi:type IV secretion system DNA-binding domain-containing protein [Methylobacterium sp. V23]|uniref:type IV secretion system DNA-binding domain-containing protein n=1 Tax=Methylobacterium sp. V23 TaxID=2044878 RepID=UPI0015E16120|nr:type IV secretion system DNA-binding domain-containing protein [Methylobacterium sp. V23]